MGRSSYDPSAGHENVFARIVASDAELPIDFHERLVREGQRHTLSGTSSGNMAAGAINTNLISLSAIPMVGKAFWIESAKVTLSSLATAQISIGADTNGRFTGWTEQMIGKELIVPVRQLFRGYEVQNGVCSLAIRRIFDADGVASASAREVYGALSVNGYAITDDLNFSAEKTILAVGDSILNGTGPTVSANLWTFKARDKFKEQGKTVRIVQMASSGSTSSEHETWRKAGRYDSVEADLIIYAVGANDAANAVSAATYRANLEAFWSHAQKRWPNAKMIVCGSSPTDNNTNHAVAETLRAEAADFVADQDSDRLFYINLGTAFTRTDASYYASTDSAGSRIHPDDDGHAAIGTLVNAAIDSLGIAI